MSPPLTACIIACDEAHELSRCLDALSFVSEIVVIVDAKSTDATEEIARARADRVEVRPYAGDIEQKRGCVALASHEWVFVVDPDEVVPADLAKALMRTLAEAPDDLAGVEVNRLTHHLGRWLRHGDFFPDWTLRVFRRSGARFEGQNPHGRIRVDGRVSRVTPPMEHYSYRDLADQIDRIQHFSGEAARAMEAAGRRATLADLLLRPPARFLRAYVLRGGFLDGVPGLVVACATGFYVFLKYAKLWERTRGLPAD